MWGGAFLHQLSCIMCAWELKLFGFLFFLNHLAKPSHVTDPQIRQAYCIQFSENKPSSQKKQIINLNILKHTNLCLTSIIRKYTFISSTNGDIHKSDNLLSQKESFNIF